MLSKYVVVTVTYNREQLLRKCIHQLEHQTVPANKIIIVNNASTDRTSAFLTKISSQYHFLYQIIECSENIGGAGGFAKGIEAALQYDTNFILILDDDALLSEDYVEKLLNAKKQYPQYCAFAGNVKVNGEIDICHRRTLSKIGLLTKECTEHMYLDKYFECDVASFCGMLVEKNLVEVIGLPHAEYFIWHDDVEYSLRIHKFSKFLIVSDAILDHRTNINIAGYHSRRYEWRDYYAVRNRILYVKEHGKLIDRLINGIDLFFRVVLRNWIFSLIKKDGYNWNYEKKLVRKAIRDALYEKVY